VGLALGYPDVQAPANAFRTERDPLEKFVQWIE
jgi:nitroreductase